jgi:uncharacterized protein (TIGR02246 family)
VEGPPEAVAAIFTADGVIGESGMADIVGRHAIAEFLTKANGIRTVTRHRLFREEIIFLGDRAIEFGRFDETKVKPGQPPYDERGRTVTDWRRESDGAWRIANLVVSDLPSP